MHDGMAALRPATGAEVLLQLRPSRATGLREDRRLNFVVT